MNDIEKAIESIKKQYIGIDYTNGKDMTVLCIYDKQAEETIRALEKQIPKKLMVMQFYEEEYMCECGMKYWRKGGVKYCIECGQLLDWEVENE